MIHWNGSPDIAVIGPFVLKWYSVLFTAGLIIGYNVSAKLFRAEGYDNKQIDRVFLYFFVSVVAGARLGHCLFYQPDVYFRHPLEILKIWEGGLASHGAAAGVMLAMALYSRRYKCGFWWLLDRVIIATPLSGALVRVGNFFNSEIVGSPTHVPWAVVFDQVDAVPRHPAQLYEAFAYLVLFAVLYRLFVTIGRARPGLVSGAYAVGIFGIRFVLEFFKENQVGFESALPLNLGQLLSVPFVILGIFLMLRSRKQSPTLESAATRLPVEIPKDSSAPEKSRYV